MDLIIEESEFVMLTLMVIGEFEERLKRIIDEIRVINNVILVIDEVHTLIGAGAAEGAIDAANILKPILARGELQCIVLRNNTILYGLRDRYELHHKLVISDEALHSAAKLAHQYISDRFLPDKAIDLVDEAGSRVRLMQARTPKIESNLDKS
eukprot:jgi/Galph1/1562/GphlegSOOS_G245.1